MGRLDAKASECPRKVGLVGAPPPLIMPYEAIARAFLAGEPTVKELVERASKLLGRSSPSLLRAARRFAKQYPPEKTRPRQQEVVDLLKGVGGLHKLSATRWLTGPQQMRPVPAAASWNIPSIETVGDLAAWLSLPIGELEWLADLKAWSTHYHYRALKKPSGAIRLIEAPKPRLKALQRKILADILEKIPPHPAVHGFLKGHSVKTFAAPHIGQPAVLKMDLEDFFPSISRARVQALFRTMGYPESVADLLGGLCTTAAPHEYEIYSSPHLPQGAPTSPALANLCAYRTDCRLAGLAKSAGASYTRYADDLAFSGGANFSRFSLHVAAILSEEGFSVNHRKTRIMRSSVRQQLAGVVVNERVNIRRSDFDVLKAILTNCIRKGPLEARDVLQGKVAWAESLNPQRGARLRALFNRIVFPDPPKPVTEPRLQGGDPQNTQER